MTARVTATTKTVSSINQQAVIGVLRDHGPLSRVRIAELTGLSQATVNRLTTAMVRSDQLVVDGQEPSNGGRPSQIYRYTGGSRVVAGVHLRRDEMTGVLADFDGRIVHRERITFDNRPPGRKRRIEKRFEEVITLVDRLQAEAMAAGTPCQAIGIAVPGVVNEGDGGVGVLPELGWPSMPLREMLAAGTSLPLVFENDANALALAEYVAGSGAGTSSMVGLLLDNGMGAGIISGGGIHRGNNGEAGEIGYLLMDRHSLSNSYADLGDLEDRVGSEALTRRARELGLRIAAGRVLNAQDVFDLAAAGDPKATEMLDEIYDMVAMAVAALSVILNPEIVVLGGSLSSGADPLMAAIRDRLNGRILRVPPIAKSALGADATLRGVVELALRHVNSSSHSAESTGVIVGRY